MYLPTLGSLVSGARYVLVEGTVGCNHDDDEGSFKLIACIPP